LLKYIKHLYEHQLIMSADEKLCELLDNIHLLKRKYDVIRKISERQNSSFEGYISKIHGEIKQPTSIIRFLRYIARVFYFHLESLDEKPVEVQVMRADLTIERNLKIIYYISTNNKKDVSNDTYWPLIYSKIKENVNENEWESNKNEKRKHKILKFVKTYKENLIKQFQTQVIFVTDFTHKDKSRHAEEYLCDQADKLKIQYGQKSMFYMYGKKRPCMTCSARMKCSGIQHYNKHHGRLFLHAVDSSYLLKGNVPKEVIEAEKAREDKKATETIKLLLEGPSYISEDLVTDYDTDSGDENFTVLTNDKDKLNLIPDITGLTNELDNLNLSQSLPVNVSKQNII